MLVHSCQMGVVMVSKKSKKKMFFFYFSLFEEKGHGIVKKVAIFDWERGRNPAPRDGQKIPQRVHIKYIADDYQQRDFSIGLSIPLSRVFGDRTCLKG